MKNNLTGRSFLTLLDYTTEEIQELLNLAGELKAKKRAGISFEPLKGKNIVLIFEKDSTRTRCAFQAGGNDLGMNVTYLGPTGSQMGKKESIKDTARVLGRMYDGIEFRGFKHEAVEILAEHSNVPVWNGLTDLYHPTQILADFLTIIEKYGNLKGINFSFFGEARNNMGNSLMIGAAKMGMNFTAVAPKELWPDEALIRKCREIAKATNATINLTEDPKEGAKNADVIYTDVWVSMGGSEQVWKERIKKLFPYQVNKDIMNSTGKDSIFMHCLPAFHNRQTIIGEDLYQRFNLDALEVTEEVFESDQSVVFDEAENRL
ncbi:MAG: ornithine carbamoyltransferase, partial [Bacillota bacterium]